MTFDEEDDPSLELMCKLERDTPVVQLGFIYNSEGDFNADPVTYIEEG